ncbi:MAG: hypothetical protein KBC96_10690 [Armatimonadetes bacterium]|nr:hypothetical protein [Armatimonadota bacterium]
MDHTNAREQADKFLAEAGQFRLGDLLTESSHPVTKQLSYVAKESTSDALKLLFQVDADVVAKMRELAESGRLVEIKNTVRDAILAGGKLFFTGCGATGRLSIQLDSTWRFFWKQQAEKARAEGRDPSRFEDLEHRTFSAMAGGDFALIKSVEGFEDFTAFGGKQVGDLGIGRGDVLFAITEGGETSFVIGTAWKAVEVGAKVYFVYNNPDDVLREHVIRSREVIEDPRIEKINITTGPMAIMGSTRMQATSSELCTMITILEMVCRDLLGLESEGVPGEFASLLAEIHSTLMSGELRNQLAKYTETVVGIYGKGKKDNYFADRLGIDVLTDTTERSPTFCIPAFRKWDDPQADESWTYLFLPHEGAENAWTNLLNRPPRGLAWSDDEILALVGPEQAPRQYEIMRQIGTEEILRFRIGSDGLRYRPADPGDGFACVVTEAEKQSLLRPGGFYRTMLEKARDGGAHASFFFLGREAAVEEVKEFAVSWDVPANAVYLPVPENDLLLDGLTRIGVKMMLNAMSTLTMVKLGRVLGNCMVALVPSNLKLIDRSTRFIAELTGMCYDDACRLLHESIEYVAPRMLSGRTYPPVVALSVMRHNHALDPEAAEERVWKELGRGR